MNWVGKSWLEGRRQWLVVTVEAHDKALAIRAVKQARPGDGNVLWASEEDLSARGAFTASIHCDVVARAYASRTGARTMTTWGRG